MIYRSRYLNRLLFSPLGYRERRAAQTAQRPERSPGRTTPLPRGVPVKGEALGERAPYLSSRELRDIIGRSERAITSGRAQIEDYEAFIICQQELSSRS